MLLIPTSATYNTLKNDYIPGICRDHTFGEPAIYQARTVQQFMHGAGKFARVDSLPTRAYDFVGFSQSGMGRSYIVGDAPLPVLKADGGFRRPKPKSTRTRKEFEELKKKGKILSSNVSLGSVLVQDAILPLLPSTGSYTSSLEVSDNHLFNAQHPCNSGTVVYAMTREGHGVWASDSTAFKPRSVGTYSVRGTYTTFPSTNLSTLMTLHKDKINAVAREISSSMAKIEVDVGLITESTAELNASAYDLLTELGELPETVSMIYDALRKIILYYLETKRKVDLIKRTKRQNEPISLLDEVASLWMAYRYGIMPIVYSVNDALDYLELKGTIFRTVRKGINTQIPLDVGDWELPDLNVRERVWAKGRFQAVSKNGLGLNPLTTAWELIPLSFVIDWALNIGDLLSALSPSVDFDERSFSYSVQCKQTLMGKHPDIPIPVPFVVDLYQRHQINPLDHIGLNFDLVLTFKRRLDALALSWFTFVKMTSKRK